MKQQKNLHFIYKIDFLLLFAYFLVTKAASKIIFNEKCDSEVENLSGVKDESIRLKDDLSSLEYKTNTNEISIRDGNTSNECDQTEYPDFKSALSKFVELEQDINRNSIENLKKKKSTRISQSNKKPFNSSIFYKTYGGDDEDPEAECCCVKKDVKGPEIVKEHRNPVYDLNKIEIKQDEQKVCDHGKKDNCEQFAEELLMKADLKHNPNNTKNSILEFKECSTSNEFQAIKSSILLNSKNQKNYSLYEQDIQTTEGTTRRDVLGANMSHDDKIPAVFEKLDIVDTNDNKSNLLPNYITPIADAINKTVNTSIKYDNINEQVGEMGCSYDIKEPEHIKQPIGHQEYLRSNLDQHTEEFDAIHHGHDSDTESEFQTIYQETILNTNSSEIVHTEKTMVLDEVDELNTEKFTVHIAKHNLGNTDKEDDQDIENLDDMGILTEEKRVSSFQDSFFYGPNSS